MAKQTLFDVAKTVLPVGTGSSSAHEPEKKKKKKQTLFDIEQEVLGGARADAIDRLRAPQPAPDSRALLPRAPASAAFQRRTPQPAPQYTRQETAPITPTGRMAQSYPAITVTPDPVYAEERAQRQAERATARERQYNEFMALKDTPDFQKYADVGAALENPSWQEADSSLRPGIFGWRPFSKPLENKVKFYKEYPAADTEAYGLMTDDEYATYNYLLGRGTYDDADAFLEIIKPQINERLMSGFIDETTSMAEESPVSASALSLITAPVQGVGALYSYGTALTGGEVDPNHPLFAISRANQAIRGTVGKKISEGAGGGFLGDALAFVYGTGMSIGDFLISRQLSVGAGEDMSKMMTGIMGTRAATDMTLSAYDRGATQNEALILGALAGAAEIFFERFSIESFERMRLSPPSVKGALFKNMLKQGGVEATEEMATELANALSDLLVMGDRSDFAIVQSQYENMGMSRQEAAAQAVIGLLGKVGLAGLGGLLSGGVLGAFATGKAAKTGDAVGEYTGSDTVNDTAYQSEFDAQATELGQKAIEFGTVDSLLAAALQTNPDGAAYQAAQFVVSSDARTSASAVGNLVFEYTLETGDARFVTPVTADYTVADMQRDTAPGANLPAVLDTDQSLDMLRQAALDSYQPQDSAFTPEIAPAADVVREPDIIPAEPEQPLESQITAQGAASVESAVEPAPVAAPEARAPVTKPGVVRNYSQSAFSALAPEARRRARAEFAALDMMAKKYDLKVEIVDKIDLADANGMYNPKTGRITVALDAVEGAYMYVGMHEMTHHIRSTTPEAYDLLEFMVLEILKENGTDVEAAIAEQIKLNNASREDATEEVVANSVGAVLADPEAVEKLVTDNPSLARRIWEFIKKLVADMRDMIKRLSKHKGFEQAGALAENAKALQEIATLFDYALADAQTVTAGGALDVQVGGEVATSKKGETKLSKTSPRDGAEVDAPVDQRISSAKTSIKQLPSLFKNKNVIFGDVNIDIGGGKFDLATEYLATLGTKNMIFDPYNRSEEFNKNTLNFLRSGNKADTATCANVLNVIAEPAARANTILETAKAIKPDGKAYFTVYEKAGDNEGHETAAGYQNNMKTADYVPEIERYFGNVQRKGKLIIASEPLENLPQAKWEVAPGKAIRFSRRKPWGIIETDEQQLRREVNLRDTEIEKLRATVESLRAELKPSVGFTPTPHSVSKIAGNLLKTTMSAYPRKELTERLTEYYTNLGNGLFNDADADDALAPLYELMRDVLDEYKVESVIPDAPEMKKYLRNTELTIGTQDRGEIEASFGSYKHFRQLLSGKLKVKLDPDVAIGNIEDVWPEFHNEFYGPNIADEYGAEMLHSLIETVEMLYENPTNNPYGYSKDEYASELAADAFIDFYTDIAKKTTFADRAQAKYDALVKKARADIAAVRADARERHNARIKTLREEQRARVKALAERHKRTVDDLKFERRAELLMQHKNLMNTHYLRMEEQRMEFRDWKTRDRLRRQNTEQRNKNLKRIKKKAADFNAWLARPTKEHHVPEFLRNGLTGVLDGINMSLKPGAKMEAKWQEQVYKLVKMLNDVFDPQVKEQREMLNNLMPGVVPFMTTVLDGLNARRGSMVLNTMTLADLEALDDSLSVVWHAVKSINRAYSVHKFKTISALGDATVAYAAGKKQASEGGRVSRYFNLDMLEPITYLHEFGPAGDALFKAFSVGESKTLSRGRESQDFFAALKKKLSVDGGTIRKWSDTVHEIALESGKTIRMTVPNVMEFYAHMNREKSVGHIYDGGIVVRTTDGSERTRKRQADVFKITPKDADKIVETLTDTQRALISAMQRFLSEDVAGWGNETTMELYLFKMFREKNYWPIRVIEGSIPIEQALADEPIFNALLNASFTKHTTPYAANPILISDVFGTFIDHVSRMAAFNGLGPVVQDALRWANYVQFGDDGKPVYNASVRKAMNNMLGPGGERYFRNFMRSMNSAEQGSFSTDISRKLISNMKVSAIAGSLRVVIQQPTAVGRAAAEINPLYLVRGATGKQRIREMQRYAPIAWIKGNGRFDIGLGRSWRDIVIGDSSILEKGSEWLLAPASWADNVTWAVIWNAVRLETADLHPELEVGTQAFFDAVSSRFTDIIDRTQVVDTTLRRSQAMRSQDLLLQTATAFMSEPTKTYNMAYRAMRDATYHKTPKAKRVLARALMAALFAQALTAFVVSLWDAGRKPDEDKEFWEKVGENWTSEMIVDTLSVAPYVRDIVSIIEGYDAERMDMKAVATTIQWLGRVGGILQTGDTGKYSMYKHATDGAKAISDLFGLPVRGTLTSFESIARMVNPDALPALSDTPVTLYNTIRAGEKANAAKMYDALVKERIRYINREETKRRNDGVPEQYADAASVKIAAMEYVDSGVAELLADDPEIADAYKYRKAGQKSNLDAVYRALESEGFTRNAVTRAIARYENKVEKKPPETQEYKDKKRFKNEHLFEAVRNGNASDVAGIYDELVRDSTADDPIQSLRNSATIEFKPDYIRYVENGDTKKAAKLADVLITQFGHTQKQLDQWVRDARSEEMHEAIEDGDVEATNKAIARQVADGKKRGDIAASITSKYKPLIIEAYVSGDREELAALVKMLTDLPLVNDKGNPYYTTTTIWGWIDKYLSDLG